MAAHLEPRTYHYVIDSRDRNTDIFPAPSRYDVTLPETINNVAYCKLLVADFPFSRYTVHAANNLVYVSENGNTTVNVVQLTPGNYEGPSLATKLQLQLNASCKATYTVTYNDITDSFAIVSNLIDKTATPPTTVPTLSFMLAFKGDSIVVDGKHSAAYASFCAARVLGFANANYVGAVKGVTAYTSTGARTGTLAAPAGGLAMFVGDTLYVTVDAGTFPCTVTAVADAAVSVSVPAAFTGQVPTGTVAVTSVVSGRIQAPFRKNLRKDRYIVLNINNAEINYGVSTVLDRSFCIINSKDCSLNNEYKFDAIKNYEPPLNSLKRLQISIYDYDGNLYDFQNQDHRLELEFSVWGYGHGKGTLN